MKPLSITLRGIGPFRDETTIDFAALASPVAIVASYGSGKSFLIEAILFALFGRGGWYSGSIYDIQTQGGDGESYIHLTFEHDGLTYRLERHIGKGHSACVYRNDEIVAGPKVGDVARWVETNVGSWETAASTWFLSQSRANDLCGQPGEKDLVARRRAVFNELLGIADLDAEAERMRAERTKCIAQVEVLEAQLADDAAGDDVDVKECLLAEAKERLEVAKVEANDAEVFAAKRRAELSEITASAQTMAGMIREANAKVKAAEQAIKNYADWTRRVEALGKRVDELASAAEDVEILEASKEARTPLLLDLAAREAWEKAAANYDRYVARQDALRREIAALRESLPGAETVVLAGRADEVQRDLQHLSLCNEKIKAHNESTAKRRALLERNIATGNAEIERLRKRIEQKPVTPFGDDCSPCPLMREWAGAPEDLAKEEANLARRRGELAEVPALLDLLDGSELLTLRAQVLEAIRSVERGEATMAKVLRLEGDLPFPEPMPGPEPADPRQQIAALQQAIEALSGAPARLDAHQRARDDMVEALQAQEESRDVAAVATSYKREAPAELNRLASRNRELAAMTTAAEAANAEARREYTKGQQNLHACHADAGRAESALQEAQKQSQAQAEKREQVRSLTVRRAALDDLVACFGPRGVRQILVDAAAPELEDIADQLFETATEGRMRLRIATQKVLKDGSTAEDFAILVKDQAGEREALEHSGGELQLVSILLRLSVCQWIVRLRGQKPDVLLLDEAFDRLGHEGAQDLLRVLDVMSDRIGTICVVTHDEKIADRLRSKVRVVKSLSGSRVEMP